MEFDAPHLAKPLPYQHTSKNPGYDLNVLTPPNPHLFNLPGGVKGRPKCFRPTLLPPAFPGNYQDLCQASKLMGLKVKYR